MSKGRNYFCVVILISTFPAIPHKFEKGLKEAPDSGNDVSSF